MNKFLLFSFSLILGLGLNAQTVSFDDYLSGFSRPVDLKHAGDDRLFVVEQDGRIQVIENDVELATSFLDITADVSGPNDPIAGYTAELGLLSMTFHPDYATNGYFYVDYTIGTNNATFATVVERYTVSAADPNVADPASGVTIITFPQLRSNHNGGALAFGPDGYLYISSGDGGIQNDPNNVAQDGMSFLGKILRIDVDGGTPYSIPADNPFVADAGFLDEIWAYGLRNPWRMSFDKETGDLWIADVGQSTREEINRQLASSTGGEHYGWRCREGAIVTPTATTTGCGPATDYVEPVFDYDHGQGVSVTGGYVYRGCNYPGLTGTYICVDYSSGNAWTVTDTLNGSFEVIAQGDNETSVSCFGEDVNGELYAVKLNGTIKKVSETTVPMTENPVVTGSGSTVSTTATGGTFQWYDENDAPISGATSSSFDPVGTGSYYVVQTIGLCEFKSNEVSLTIDGIIDFSKTQTIEIVPNPVNDFLSVTLGENEQIQSIAIYNNAGQLIKEIVADLEQSSRIDVSNLDNGLYFISIQGDVMYRAKFIKE